MKRLLYSELATDDLKGILDYIARDKPIAARAFVDGIIDTCHLIASNPEIGMWREDWRRSFVCLPIKGMASTTET